MSIENGVGVGTPDVNCALGWLELKSVNQPASPDTKVHVGHFTKEQRIWLLRRWRAGGCACLLLKVGSWWLLFDPPTAFESVGKLTLNELIARCFDGWQGTPDKETFVGAMIDLCSRKTFRGERGSTSPDSSGK